MAKKTKKAPAKKTTKKKVEKEEVTKEGVHLTRYHRMHPDRRAN